MKHKRVKILKCILLALILCIITMFNFESSSVSAYTYTSKVSNLLDSHKTQLISGVPVEMYYDGDRPDISNADQPIADGVTPYGCQYAQSCSDGQWRYYGYNYVGDAEVNGQGTLPSLS